MAKSKKQVENLKGYFFLSVGDGSVNSVYDDNGDKVVLSAAFASAMIEDTNLFDIISTAFLTLIESKEKTPVKKKAAPKKKSSK